MSDDTAGGSAADKQTEPATEKENTIEENTVYEPIDKTFTKKGVYSIRATAGADAQIPADAVLAVSEIPQNSLQYYTLDRKSVV